MQRIIPTLWSNDTAQEAVDFYTSVFDDVRVGRTDYYTDAGKEQHGHNAGEIVTIEFQIANQTFILLNGGDNFKINPSISFFVNCQTSEEVDALWGKLSEGGTTLMPLDAYPFSKRYGWLSDKFGVSWQIILTDDASTDRIIPSLLFTKEHAGQAEEAIHFYTSVFPDSSVGDISRYGADQAPDQEGTVMYAPFTIAGHPFVAMDSAQAHNFTFNEAVSLLVECDSQDEIDRYWNALSADPNAEVCGWLKDKFGVSWQIAPTRLNEMLASGTREQVERVTAAYMQMKKFDIAELERVYLEK